MAPAVNSSSTRRATYFFSGVFLKRLWRVITYSLLFAACFSLQSRPETFFWHHVLQTMVNSSRKHTFLVWKDTFRCSKQSFFLSFSAFYDSQLEDRHEREGVTSSKGQQVRIKHCSTDSAFVHGALALPGKLYQSLCRKAKVLGTWEIYMSRAVQTFLNGGQIM